jgi:tetratricopeptide (TPR) repeat protein
MLTQFLLLALAAESPAIQGYVRDARTHDAVPFASVELRRAQTPIDQRYTDNNGHFEFRYPNDGGYTLAVEASGYEPSRVEIDALQNAPWLSIDLVRRKASAANEKRVMSLREYMAPEKARREFDLARNEIRTHGCANAIPHFENGLKAFRQDAGAHNDLGNCYRALGQLERAENEFQQARMLSDSVYIVLNLAEVYTAQKRFKEAETVLLETIEKHVNSGDAYYGLTLVYFGQGLFEQAEAAAVQADRRPHKIADLHLVLAEIYWGTQRLAEARQQLEAYLVESPNGSESKRVRQVLESPVDVR